MAVILSLLLILSAAQTRECPSSLAKAAEEHAATIRSPEELYSAFQRYAVCDDGAIAEGFSDAVTILLSYKWKSLARINQCAEKDPRLRAFLLKHVDPTADAERLKKIRGLATTQCSRAATRLCADLIDETGRTIQKLQASGLLK